MELNKTDEYKILEKCSFLYILSYTNRDIIRVPKNLDCIKTKVYSIIGGRGACAYDNHLYELIEETNDMYDVFNDVFVWQKELIDENTLDKYLQKLHMNECQIKYRKTSGHPYYTNEYGNLLQDVSSVKLSNTKNILYIGLEALQKAEYSTYSNLWQYDINQEVIN